MRFKTRRYNDFTIIIPTLNEDKNIGQLICTILKLYPGIKIIVSDDGSKDSTKEVVCGFGKKVKFIDRSNKKIKGLTISLIDGLKLSDTKFVIVMDGDFQHPPEKLGIMMDLLHEYELVVAIRKNVEKINLSRRLVSKIANFLAKLKLKVNYKNFSNDPMSGFFGIRKSLLLDSINNSISRYELKGYKILFDFLKSYNRKIRVKEVIFDFAKRKENVSKLNKKHIFYFIRSLFN